MRFFWRCRRWWVKRFRTSVRPAVYNRHGGITLTMEEWKAQGEWSGALTSGWLAQRPNWWQTGGSSGATDATAEAALAKLDEWQDDMARRARDKTGTDE